MAIEWSDDLSVGNAFYRRSAQRVVQAVNDLMSAMWTARGRSKRQKRSIFCRIMLLNISAQKKADAQTRIPRLREP